MNESDSDLPLDDDEVEENERPRKKNKQKTWIAENADEIVDFTDIRASHKITGLYSFLLNSYSVLVMQSYFLFCVFMIHLLRKKIVFTNRL